MTIWDLDQQARMEATRLAVHQLEASLADAVQCARDAGATWDDVGAALGIARQSAWRKYKERKSPVTADTQTQLRHCSFCGKAQGVTEHLVAAPTGASICDECLDLAHSMMTSERTRLLTTRK